MFLCYRMHEAKPLGAPNEAQGASATSSPFVMKTITLHREFHSQGFGFCLRGGVEHGVGHFVSSVDLGSIAESQGIKAGDQILSVEGLPLTTATHKEAVSFIASRNKVLLIIEVFRIYKLNMTIFIPKAVNYQSTTEMGDIRVPKT